MNIVTYIDGEYAASLCMIDYVGAVADLHISAAYT